MDCDLPKRSCAQDESFQIKTFHQNFDTAVHFTKKVFSGYKDVFKDEFACVGAAHAKLVQFTGTREALEALLNHESSDTFGGFLGLSLGIYNDEVCIRALWIELA